jgi:hypothetical protein
MPFLKSLVSTAKLSLLCAAASVRGFPQAIVWQRPGSFPNTIPQLDKRWRFQQVSRFLQKGEFYHGVFTRIYRRSPFLKQCAPVSQPLFGK